MRISQKRLLELGFCQEYRDTFQFESIIVVWNAKTIEVYISAQQTTTLDYARPVLNCKKEKDLLDLMRIIDGQDKA